ncbi:hypothetical protein BDF22DRAFT_674293 [Syncephalis plumigaleata]|nr:hypothetical protein BDF22DRAFT_674293 [Syncephalis plumigaleata]
MILSRYSFDADMIEARNSNHSATSPLPSHTHWLATSTTPSSPYISDNNQQQQRQQQRQSISNESDDSEYDIHDTIVNDTLEVRGQYRRLQSPEAFRSIVRESNQTRQPHPQSPNVHLLEHRSPSFADIASIRGSLARRFAREQSRLMNNEHNHHHQNASHLSSLFMNTNENNDPFGIFSYDTTHMDDVERQPNNTELWNTIGRMLTASNDDDDDNDEFDYEDLLALSELIGEVRSRGASEYQLAQLKQVTVEEHKRSLDVTTNVDMELYRCTICLDEYAPKEMVNVFPSCNHVFHEICIQQWLTHNQACPLCRCII